MAASFKVIVKDGLFNKGKGALGVGGQLGFIGYKYYREYDVGGGAEEFIYVNAGTPGELGLKSTQMAIKCGNFAMKFETIQNDLTVRIKSILGQTIETRTFQNTGFV